VNDHRAFVEGKGVLAERRARRLADELREIVAERLHRRALDLCGGPAYERLRDDVLGRRLDPWSAADEIVGPVGA
jgi:LAO/AO transport system kinase